MSVYTRPPSPPPATDGPIFPSLDIAGYGRGSLQKKKKEKLVGLVGWFVSFPYSFINHRHFFYFFFDIWCFGDLVFCRVIVLLPFLYTYSFLDIVFTQVTSPNAPNFLRFLRFLRIC